jgi:hypothetical protein
MRCGSGKGYKRRGELICFLDPGGSDEAGVDFEERVLRGVGISACGDWTG